MIAIDIPGMRLLSENEVRRLYWRRRAESSKRERWLVRALLHGERGSPPKPPLVIVITRCSPGKLDSDNLAGACKALRDGVADWLGVDDGSDELTWRYSQERGAWGVRIQVEERLTGEAVMPWE